MRSIKNIRNKRVITDIDRDEVDILIDDLLHISGETKSIARILENALDTGDERDISEFKSYGEEIVEALQYVMSL